MHKLSTLRKKQSATLAAMNTYQPINNAASRQGENKMTKTFDEILDDAFDIRDVIERYEELDGGSLDADEIAEFSLMADFLDEVKGTGGDEQWRGDWYPVGFIKDSYFENAMDEMLEDCGDMPKYQDIPSYLTITVNYDALQMDYSSVEIKGDTYWYR
jgi:hypothetical protein